MNSFLGKAKNPPKLSPNLWAHLPYITRNNTVEGSWGFLFASCILGLELKNLATWMAHTLLVGIQNGTGTLEHTLVAS